MSESPIVGTPVVTQRSPVITPAPRSRWPTAMQIMVVVAIFGGGVVLTALTSDVTKESEPGVKLVDGHPFLIDKIGDWTGGELRGLNDIEKGLLPPDTESARRTFTDRNGDELFCSVVLAGRDVTSIHRPELCLPGQGWTIENEYVQSIPVAAAPGGALEVMRMNAVRSIPLADGRTARYPAIFVYWFAGKDRVTPYHWQRIWWTSKDRVLHNTNHRWAYILISMPVTGDTTPGTKGDPPEETMKVMSGFIRDVYPTLVER